MGTLARHVSVRDDLGVIHSFGPDDEVPDWAAQKITNPTAWEDGDVPFPGEATSGESKPGVAPTGGQAVSQDLEDRIVSRVLEGVGDLLRDLVAVVDDGEETEGDADSGATTPPPRAGRGSGEDKWRAYAASKGADVTAIEDRNEIIAFLESQGIPVE